jgi:hypothetical protein
MPEERAFAVFVCLMYNGNLRNIYINDFEGLSRILFFIDQLLNDGSSKLRKHLINNNIGNSFKNSHYFSTDIQCILFNIFNYKFQIVEL